MAKYRARKSGKSGSGRLRKPARNSRYGGNTRRAGGAGKRKSGGRGQVVQIVLHPDMLRNIAPPASPGEAMRVAAAATPRKRAF